MKKEMVKTKNFDISKFEVLDVNGNALLKGGFSAAYTSSAASGAGVNASFKNCKCTTTNNCGEGTNCVAGCGGSDDGTVLKPNDPDDGTGKPLE